MKKDILLVFFALLSVGLIIAVVGLYNKSNQVNRSLEEERYSRMVAEESLQKNAGKVATLEAQLKSANDKMAKVEDLISKEKNVNHDLQKQYEEISKAKEDLENKLKAALDEKVLSSTVSTNSTVPATQ